MASSFNHQQTSNGKESDTDVDCCGGVTEPGVWKWRRGYMKNWTCQRPFTSLAGNLGDFPSPAKKMNLGLAEM